MHKLVLQIFVILGIATAAIAAPQPDLAGFKSAVAPFFDVYCMECHDELTEKGNFSLEGVNPNVLTGGDTLEAWRLIDEQIRFGDMPPEDEKQPTAARKTAVLAWIRGELLKTQRPGFVVDEKLQLPEFGNYVDHTALFGKRLDRVYPAPPRIWRLRPDIYDATLPRLGEKVAGLAAGGLSQLDGPEFDDYAAPYFIDEASTNPLLGNAKKIVAAMTCEKTKDKLLKEIVALGQPPADEKIQSAIEYTFRKVLGRNPTEDEQERFFAYYHKAKAAAGHEIAGRSMLTAILMQPEVLYRQELGNGEPDQHGRIRLSPREIYYALSYALDNRPRDEFNKARQEGKLEAAEGIAEAVAAALQDDSRMYNKNPRIFQFFREYFDYPYANEVFKDPPPGGSHNAGTLINDLELTIRDILKGDEEVLATLLTTRDYYVQTTYDSQKRGEGVMIRAGGPKRDKFHTAYNLPLDWKWTDQQPLTFREDERAGVLTHPAWLVAWSGNFENHPVQRGKWIRTHLLGGSVPDVPIGVDARVPEKEHTSFRNRLREATAAAECWRCHKKMDPLGVAFERYDHYGRYQRIDATEPVVATGLIHRTGIPELDGREVGGPTEMMEILAKSEHVEQVFVRHVFRYFMSRNETLGDANTLQDAHKAYRDSGGSFNALVVFLLSSDSFLYREIPTTR